MPSSVGPGDGTVTGRQTGDDDSGTWFVIFVLHIGVKVMNSNPKPQVKEKLGHGVNLISLLPFAVNVHDS